jgi:hypothetical protein
MFELIDPCIEVRCNWLRQFGAEAIGFELDAKGEVQVAENHEVRVPKPSTGTDRSVVEGLVMRLERRGRIGRLCI